MAIEAKGMKLEELQEKHNHRGSKRNELTTLYVGKHLNNDDLGFKLNIDYEHKFRSIFGNTHSIGNVMRYISYSDAKPSWINSSMRKEDYAFMKRSSKKRDVPNFWNILTLILTDRLLSDRDLLEEVNSAFPGNDIDKIRTMPMIEVKRGLIKDVIFNERLKVYGIILGIHLRLIINEFREAFGETSIIDLDNDDFKEFKLNVKTKVIDRVFENLKSNNLLDGLDTDADNEDIRKTFLGVK